eukprot:gene25690-66869_t
MEAARRGQAERDAADEQRRRVDAEKAAEEVAEAEAGQEAHRLRDTERAAAVSADNERRAEERLQDSPPCCWIVSTGEGGCQEAEEALSDARSRPPPRPTPPAASLWAAPVAPATAPIPAPATALIPPAADATPATTEYSALDPTGSWEEEEEGVDPEGRLRLLLGELGTNERELAMLRRH